MGTIIVPMKKKYDYKLFFSLSIYKQLMLIRLFLPIEKALLVSKKKTI